MPSNRIHEPCAGRAAPEDALRGQGGGDYVGRTLDGRYRLERLLGRGGMGSVFYARHVAVGRPLAVKILESHLTSSDGATRIFREAQSAAAIGHPNIVDIIDVGVSPLGDPYLVMEYLEGEDLQSYMQREWPLSMATACAVLEPVLLALSAAHRKGVVHRDLKPANIYLARREGGSATVKLIDFGIAKFMGAATDGRLTMTGALLGTPSYMSPEQAVGVVEVDERADLYAVGVILYQFVVGRLPFEGANYNEILFRILNDEPRAPETIPGLAADASAVIRKAIAKNPSNRYQSAQDFLAALRSLSAWTKRDDAFAQLTARIKAPLLRQSAANATSSDEPSAQHAAPRGLTRAPSEALPSTPVAPHREPPSSGAACLPVAPPSGEDGDDEQLGGSVSSPVVALPLESPATDPTRLSPKNPALEAACLRVLSRPGGPDGVELRATTLQPDIEDGGVSPAPTRRSDMLPVPEACIAASVSQPTTSGGVAATPARDDGRVNRLATLAAIATAALIGVGVWNRVAPRVRPGMPHESAALNPAVEGVLVTVTGAPDGATVYFDGSPVSRNPFRARRSKVGVAIRVEAPGFESFVTTIVPSENTTLGVAMRRSPTQDEPSSERPKAAPDSASGVAPAPPLPAGRLRETPSATGTPEAKPARPRSLVTSAAAEGSGGSNSTMQKSGRGTLYTDKFE